MTSEILTIEQQILLNLTSVGIGENPPFPEAQYSELSDGNWARVYLESCSHAVALATFDALNDAKKCLPEKVSALWRRYAMSCVANNTRVMCAQKELVEILTENNVPYVILKGSAAGEYYHKPELRIHGDVDFLIDKENVQRVENLLVASGYVKEQDEHPNHYVFKKQRAHLEMHFDVAGIPYGKVGDKVRTFLGNVTLKSVQKSHDDHVFCAPNDVCHGLILILHTQHHLLGEGIGLRHLCDWATFVAKTQNENFWMNELIPFLKEIGLYVFVSVITAVCVKYLSVPKPKWLDDVDEQLRDELMSDILIGGNFGRKNKNRANSGMIISEHGKSGTKHSAIYNLSHALHKAVLRKKAVKKCILLYPFVYVYKAVRFLFLSLIGKRPSIIKMLPEAEKRKNVYEKLHIFEIESKEKR